MSQMLEEVAKGHATSTLLWDELLVFSPLNFINTFPHNQRKIIFHKKKKKIPHDSPNKVHVMLYEERISIILIVFKALRKRLRNKEYIPSCTRKSHWLSI